MFGTYALSHHIINDYYKEDVNDHGSRFKGRMILAYAKLLVLSKNSKQLVAPFDMLKNICKRRNTKEI